MNLALRSVRGKIYSNGQWQEFAGSFHRWGLSFEETRENSFNFTIAIVERPSGEIITPLPENVIFTDR